MVGQQVHSFEIAIEIEGVPELRRGAVVLRSLVVVIVGLGIEEGLVHRDDAVVVGVGIAGRWARRGARAPGGEDGEEEGALQCPETAVEAEARDEEAGGAIHALVHLVAQFVVVVPVDQAAVGARLGRVEVVERFELRQILIDRRLIVADIYALMVSLETDAGGPTISPATARRQLT